MVGVGAPVLLAAGLAAPAAASGPVEGTAGVGVERTAAASGPVEGTAGVGVERTVAVSGPAERTVAAVRAVAVQVATGRVRVDGALNVRPNASTWHPPVDRLADRAPVPAQCRIGGEPVTGPGGRSTAQWLRIGDQRYVTDAYVEFSDGSPDLPWCDQPADPAPGSREEFIEWAAERAAASRAEYRVPVSVAVAQSINESGWGGSALTAQGNSFFGIKCFGTPGPVATGCRPYHTSECDQSGCFPTTATFRVYRSAADSFLDHGRFLTVNPRYRPAFDHTGDPDRFAREIHRAGYATDPHYSDKLIGLMRAYDLYRFDD